MALILQAAQAEFIRFGVTGARIDRIAKEAGASKERLYAYFGDKQGLFDRVIHTAFERFTGAVRIDHDDLVAYTGQLVEHFSAHPHDLRLLWWTKLDVQYEQALSLEVARSNHAQRVAAVQRAQARGLVDPRWDPDELLQLILAIATYWASATESGGSTAQHRATAEEAVRRLIEPQR
jgi:AcrR family transcriptional regulator